MPPAARLLTLSIVVLSAMLTGCGDATESAGKWVSIREPYTLVLAATGNATIDTLIYVFDDKTVRETAVSLPWRASVDVPIDGERHEWRLTVQHGPGDVELVATLNGNLLTQSWGGGTGNGTVNVSGSLES